MLVMMAVIVDCTFKVCF